MGALVKMDNAATEVRTRQEPEQYLTFLLGGEMFAIGILVIKEIIEFGQVTEVPRMPGCVRGVINLRGAVVPVIDLSVRFGRPVTEPGRRTCIVIVETGEGEARQVIGVMVDAVSEVLEIPQADIEPAPGFGTRIRADFIAGMGKVRGRFVMILNVEQVFLIDEMAGLDTAETQVAH
ncbi:MAG: chemotaxis protein CheW [Betaproteobacteria bacterium]|nr:chemotaxis protein CheW [Betaproteobacteria bacterium]